MIFLSVELLFRYGVIISNTIVQLKAFNHEITIVYCRSYFDYWMVAWSLRI